MDLTGTGSVVLDGFTAFANIVIDNKFLTFSQANSPTDRQPIWICTSHEIHVASYHPSQ